MSIPNYDLIPEHCRQGMKLYIEKGIAPGHFLKAVLSNDLQMTFRYADEINAKRIEDYVGFIVWEIPWQAWGSKERVEEWCKIGGLHGMLKSEKMKSFEFE